MMADGLKLSTEPDGFGMYHGWFERDGAGQLSAAISAEVKRGELKRLYVKQVESARVSEFSNMSDEELERFIREPDALIRSKEPGVPLAVPHNPSAAQEPICRATRRGASEMPRHTCHRFQSRQLSGEEETCGEPILRLCFLLFHIGSHLCSTRTIGWHSIRLEHTSANVIQSPLEPADLVAETAGAAARAVTSD